MPLMNNNPVYGIDTILDSRVETSAGYILKSHNTIIMDKDNPWVLVHYGMDPLQDIDENGNPVILSLPFIFDIKLQFITDDNDSGKYGMQISGEEINGINTIFVSLINWGVGETPGIIDIITDKKLIIDCGNGVGLFMQLRLYNTPTNPSYIADLYIYSKIIEELLVEDDDESSVEITEESSDNTDSKIIDYKDLVKESMREDALYNRDDYDDGEDDKYNE